MQPIGFNKKKFSEKMKAEGFDFLIASSPENIFYTSGLPTRHSENNPILFSLSNLTPTIVVVRQDGEESVVTWAIFDPELTWIKDFRGIMSKDDALETLINILKETGIQGPTIAVESFMPFYQYEALKKAFKQVRWKVIDDDDNLVSFVTSDRFGTELFSLFLGLALVAVILEMIISRKL